MNKAASSGPAPAVAALDAELRSLLSRHLHDLKNLLWPVTVQAECGATGAVSPAFAELMQRIGRDVQEALAIATQMSTLLDRDSQYCAARAAGQVVPAAARPLGSKPSGLRILCVDDDPGVRGALARLLKHLGHDVDLSCSGVDALQAVASRPYDLVMTDTHLADMSGRDLTRNIRALGPIPVIWLTDRDLAVTRNLANAPDSPSDVLTKPLSLGDLRKALDSIAAPAVASSATP